MKYEENILGSSTNSTNRKSPSTFDEKFYRKSNEELKQTNEELVLKLKNQKLLTKSYAMKYIVMKKAVVRKNKSIKNLKESNKKHIVKKIEQLNYLNNNEKAFCNLILKRKCHYTHSDKFISQNIYYRSPSIYRYMKETLKIKLPAVKTVLSWSKIKFINPDINHEVVKIIAKKVNTFSDLEKHAIKTFDEIAIKRSFVYNILTDQIDGFQQIGLNRKPLSASEAGFFMLRGVFSNWRIPFSYYLSKNSIKGENLKDILLNYISFCKKNFGLKILATVADQGTPNQKAYKLLGVTRESPYFFDKENIKVFAMYDYPHLIKSVRNTFLKNNFKFTDPRTNEKVEGSFKIIRDIWENEKTKITKKLPKITQQHVYPNNFDKMKVKFAVQILSNTTASAIKAVCNDTNDNLFSQSDIIKYALPTAKICEMFNNCFDCFNKVSIFNKDLQGQKVGYIDAYDFLKNDMLEFQNV